MYGRVGVGDRATALGRTGLGAQLGALLKRDWSAGRVGLRWQWGRAGVLVGRAVSSRRCFLERGPFPGARGRLPASAMLISEALLFRSAGRFPASAMLIRSAAFLSARRLLESALLP